jgi:DNA-binding MarR family transcriptional regulator
MSQPGSVATPASRRRRDLPLPVRTWVRLMRVYNRIDRRSAASMRAWNLSVGRFDVINHAGLNEGATQQELADALLVTKGNIAQLLDSLERDGLLCRERCGRTNRIYLTVAGHDVRSKAMARHTDIIASAMSALSDEEQEHLSRLLRKLERGLDFGKTRPATDGKRVVQS